MYMYYFTFVRVDGSLYGTVFIEGPYWWIENDMLRKNECVWMVPGTVDPMED